MREVESHEPQMATHDYPAVLPGNGRFVPNLTPEEGVGSQVRILLTTVWGGGYNRTKMKMENSPSQAARGQPGAACPLLLSFHICAEHQPKLARVMTLCLPTLSRETVTPPRYAAHGGQLFRLISVRRLQAETQRDGAATDTQNQRNRREACTPCANLCASTFKSPQPRINFVDPRPPLRRGSAYSVGRPAARTLRTVSDAQSTQ